MKIGIDIQAAKGPLTGLGVYTQNLLEALLREQANGFEFTLLGKEQKKDWNTLQRLLWENRDLPRRVRAEGIEILHVPAFAPPWAKPCKLVVTVHDLIGMIFPNQLGWPSRFYWGRWLPESVRKADALIADSENTKEDLVKHLGITPSRISVIYPSGHEGFMPCRDEDALTRIQTQFRIKKKYFLTVGTLEPRKNIAGAVRAFSKFVKGRQSAQSDFQLVVVGLTDFAHGEFMRRVVKECAGDLEDVLLAGYVRRSELNLLYSGAEAFVFPSLYEGFGIPVLEAMASGTPVMTSRSSSLPEVGGDAVLYCDPRDVTAMADGMRHLAEDKSFRQRLIAKGLERIKGFSWRSTAKKTLEVYEAVAYG